MAAAETASGAYAATWRDRDDQIVATTNGSTMCWDPRLPWRLRIEREGYSHIIRCRACPGCREFERRRLADRLSLKYGAGAARLPRDATSPPKRAHPRARSAPAPLYLVRIFAPLSRHARIAHALRRRRGLDLETGLYRLGSSSFAILSRERARLPALLRRMGLRSRVEPVRFSRGRRAWRAITAGLMVAREVYGEETKRWYALGLPAAPRESWEVRKLETYRPYDRRSAPRAWTSGNLVLVPPEVWKLSRTDRRSVRALLSHAPDPESVQRVMEIVNQVTSAQALRSVPLAVSERPKLSREQVQDWYRQMLARKSARSDAPDDRSLGPLSDGGRYTSSVHSSPGDRAGPLPDEALTEPGASGKPRWQERELLRAGETDAEREQRRERGRKALHDALESLRKKLTGGKS